MKNLIFHSNRNKSRVTAIYNNINGAPFKINDMVKILNNPNNDETFNSFFSFNEGSVIYFEYDCGCGQNFPDDPMIGVKFNCGAIEEFWKEELLLIS
jgi:hypothetical protein